MPPAMQRKVDALKDAGFVQYLAKAEEYRSQQEYKKAAEALTRAALLKPDDPRPPFKLCMLLTSFKRMAPACQQALKAVELAPGQHLGVLPSEARAQPGLVPPGVYPQIGLRAAVMAFDLLIRAPCDDVPRPAWWVDAELLKMSARALADTPDSPYALSVRSSVLVGVTNLDGARQRNGVVAPRGWTLGERSSSELREASMLLARQAKLEPPGSAQATQALRNSASILEAAARLEAGEKARKQPPPPPPTAALAAATAAEARSPPASPSASRSLAVPTSPSTRAEALRARRAELVAQVAALEQQLGRAAPPPPPPAAPPSPPKTAPLSPHSAQRFNRRAQRKAKLGVPRSFLPEADDL